MSISQASSPPSSFSISDIAPLATMTGVRSLDLSNNEIVDASPLEQIQYTTCAEVNLTGNPGEPSFDGVADSLCASGVVVEGYCVPEGCEPCIACLY